jgi:rhomboid protease GluP
VETIIRQTWLTRRPSLWAEKVSVLVSLLIVIGSVVYWQDWGGSTSLMAASFENVFGAHEYWRAWSTLLVHADPKHLLSNLFLFFILSSFLVGYFGFFVFPVTAFFFGGITNLIVLKQMPKNIHLIGASGIVFWMGGAWLTLYFLLDTQRTISQRALRAVGVALILFVPAEAFDPQISYLSHLVGFSLGVLWAVIYYFWNREKFLASEIKEIVQEEPQDL